MPLPHTGTENGGRKTPQRPRLSDITNTAPANLSRHRDENQPCKGSETQLHKDLATLRKALAEKEEIIEAQKGNMDKLWTNYSQKTKQNEEIIQQNAQLYKDLMQARDRLKILQHENVQMAAVHKFCKSELQAKLTKALEQGIISHNMAGSSILDPADKQVIVPSVLTKLAESRARRTVSPCKVSSEVVDSTKHEPFNQSATSRSTLRQRSTLSYKEPSLKVKLRQPDTVTPSQLKPRSHQQERRIQNLHRVYEEEASNVSVDVKTCNFEIKVKNTFESVSESTSIEGRVEQFAEHQVERLNSPSVESQMTPLSVEETEKPLRAMYSECGEDQTSQSASFVETGPNGRPCRRSVSCISSYKETALKTKMRWAS